MGQYYLIVNIDKQQYLTPSAFGNGLKLLEFGMSSGGALTGLAVLLADGNGRGGGDLKSQYYTRTFWQACIGEVDENEIPYHLASPPIVGSWAGDRIVIAGDYGDPLKFLPTKASHQDLQDLADEAFTEEYRQAERVNLYCYAEHRFEDISKQVIEAMLEDAYIRADWLRYAQECPWDTQLAASLDHVRSKRPELFAD